MHSSDISQQRRDAGDVFSDLGRGLVGLDVPTTRNVLILNRSLYDVCANHADIFDCLDRLVAPVIGGHITILVPEKFKDGFSTMLDH